jgi:glycosyltransferase involved in cell wall biosynthesis
VHDLTLVNTAFSAARKFGIPLIADLHEIYPEALKSWNSRPLISIPLKLARWEYQEKLCFRNADAVIVVSEEAKEYYVEKYDAPADKVNVVMNTVDLSYFYSFPIEQEIVEKLKQYFVICSSGNQGFNRGIHTAVLALPKIVSRIPEARLLLVGPASRETLEEWVNSASGIAALDKHVIFTGWQEPSLFPSYITASSVGILPVLTNTPQTNFSSPNRLFEYMALGKPVVVSSARSLKRIIEQTESGLVFESGNPDEFADAVIRLYEDKELAARMGKAGLNAAKTKYNWEVEGKKLTELYQELSS